MWSYNWITVHFSAFFPLLWCNLVFFVIFHQQLKPYVWYVVLKNMKYFWNKNGTSASLRCKRGKSGSCSLSSLYFIHVLQVRGTDHSRSHIMGLVLNSGWRRTERVKRDQRRNVVFLVLQGTFSVNHTKEHVGAPGAPHMLGSKGLSRISIGSTCLWNGSQ